MNSISPPHHEVGDHPVENWNWSRKSFYKRWESQESIHFCMVTWQCFVLQYWRKVPLAEFPASPERIHVTGRVDPHLGKVERSLDLILENCHYWDSFVLYSSSSFNNRSHWVCQALIPPILALSELRSEEQFVEERISSPSLVVFNINSRKLSFVLRTFLDISSTSIPIPTFQESEMFGWSPGSGPH